MRAELRRKLARVEHGSLLTANASCSVNVRYPRQIMISWRGLLLIALFLRLARNEARDQQRRRKRLRERARRRRVTTFIKQQGRCKQALIILVAACSLSQPRSERSVWMLPRTSHDYGTCNIRRVPQLFQSHSVYRAWDCE